jgi:hypothetical protein
MKRRGIGIFLQVLALAVGAIAPPAFAQYLGTSPCASIDLEKAGVGVRCRTSVGGEFRRYIDPASGALGWEDLGASGRVWYDEVKINSAQSEAAGYCAAKPGQGVPTLDDLGRASARGLKEVIKDSFKNVRKVLLWSSQIDADSGGQRAVGLAVDAGDFQSVPKSESFDNALVICVGPPATLR